jgi:hypothetical protein
MLEWTQVEFFKLLKLRDTIAYYDKQLIISAYPRSREEFDVIFE